MTQEIDWERFWDKVSTNVWVCSITSFAISMFMVLLFCCRPRWRRTPGWLLQRALICDGLAAAGFMCFAMSSFSLEEEDLYVTKAWWMTTILWIAASEIGANSWRLVMFLHLVVIYRNPFKPDRCNLVYPLVVGTIMVVALGICWYLTGEWDPKGFYAGVKSAIFFPVMIYPGFFVVSGGLVQFGISSAIRSDRSGQHHASISFDARERLIRHGYVYLSLHAVQLAVGTTVFALLEVTQWRNEWFWQAIVALMCGRPSWSCIGWMVLIRKGSKVFRWEEAAAPVTEATRKEETASRVTATRSQEPTAADAESDKAIQLASLGADTPSGRRSTVPLVRMSEAVRHTVHQDLPGPRIGAHDLMHELRFEVLYDVARSIGEFAQRQMQQAALEERRTPQQEGRPASCIGFGLGTPVPEMRTADELVSSAGLVNWSPVREHQRRQTVQENPTALLLPAKHHRAEEFSAIREAFGISPEQYARDFPNQLSGCNSRWVQKLRESVSEGASGSFFYRVLSEKSTGVTSQFIVKEIQHSELRTLMNILPAYRRHVQDLGGRSFIQYFGCHSVPLRWKYAAKVHFVVMRNFLPVPMWLVFDLKGATANRRALKKKSLMEVRAQGEVGRGRDGKYGTLRDWEWMDIAMVVDVSPEDKVDIAETLRADSEFLARQGLLDYSLLVGIHRVPADVASTAKAREDRLEELMRAGGYVSLDRQKVYFFGIIDVLERFSLRWRAQHAVLTTAYHVACYGRKADGISAMAPDLYADRFYTFMLKEVLQWGFEHGEEEDRPPSRRLCGACCGGESVQGLRRWGLLWDRRWRGLVRERMEAERSDFLRRIEQLEREVEEVQQGLPIKTRNTVRQAAGDAGFGLGRVPKQRGTFATLQPVVQTRSSGG